MIYYIMENKYMKGKIYKLVDVGYNKCYIGSTIENLSNRIAKHRYSYKMWCSGKPIIKCTVFDMFEEFGIDNIKIEEIEKYPCKDKAELEAREGFFIKNSDCVNKTIVGRTKKQWEEDNKDHIKQNKQNYYQQNKDALCESTRQYYHNNCEKIKLTFICECGGSVTVGHKTRHRKTLKHQNYINHTNKNQQIVLKFIYIISIFIINRKNIEYIIYVSRT